MTSRAIVKTYAVINLHFYGRAYHYSSSTFLSLAQCNNILCVRNICRRKVSSVNDLTAIVAILNWQFSDLWIDFLACYGALISPISEVILDQYHLHYWRQGQVLNLLFHQELILSLGLANLWEGLSWKQVDQILSL